MIVVQVSGGGATGLGYTYGAAATAQVVERQLADVVTGRCVWDVPAGAADVEERGGRALAVPTDMADPARVAAVTAEEAFGPIDTPATSPRKSSTPQVEHRCPERPRDPPARPTAPPRLPAARPRPPRAGQAGCDLEHQRRVMEHPPMTRRGRRGDESRSLTEQERHRGDPQNRAARTCRSRARPRRRRVIGKSEDSADPSVRGCFAWGQAGTRTVRRRSTEPPPGGPGVTEPVNGFQRPEPRAPSYQPRASGFASSPSPQCCGHAAAPKEAS